MTLLLSPQATACDKCGHDVTIIDRFKDYSTTRGPMTEHVVTRCPSCGEQHLLHLAAQSTAVGARRA